MKVVGFSGAPSKKDAILEAFGSSTCEFIDTWKRKLIQDCTVFPQIEEAAHRYLSEVQSWLILALLSDPDIGQTIERQGELHRKELKLRQGNRVKRNVVFLCGLKLKVSCWYATPPRIRARGRPRGQGQRKREGSGLYPELALLGIHEGISPALGNEATRQAVLLTSMEQARIELERKACP